MIYSEPQGEVSTIQHRVCGVGVAVCKSDVLGPAALELPTNMMWLILGYPDIYSRNDDTHV